MRGGEGEEQRRFSLLPIRSSAEDTETKAPIDPSSKVDTAFGLNIPSVAHYVGTKQKQTFSGENGLSVLWILIPLIFFHSEQLLSPGCWRQDRHNVKNTLGPLLTQTNKQKNSETGGKLSSKGRKKSSYQHDSTDMEKHLKSIEHNHSKNTRHSKGYIKCRWRVLSQCTTGAQEIRLLQTSFHINLILTHPFFNSWTSFSLFRRFSSTLFFWLTVSSTLSSKQP